MRILFVLEYFKPNIGGVETLFDKLMSGLVDHGFDIDIVTTQLPGTKKQETDGGRRIFRVPTPFRHVFPFTGISIVSELSKKADMIHTTTYSAAGLVGLSRKFVKRPTAITVHEVWGKLFYEISNPVSATMNSFLEKSVCNAYKNSTVISPSEFTKNSLKEIGIDGGNVHVIPHGIDHSVFNLNVSKKYDWDFPNYLFFGRPGISKGLDYLLPAVKQISREIPKSKLVLMMSNKKARDYNKAMRNIESLGIKKNILLIDSESDYDGVASVIKSSDCACVPSLSEGFGFSAVESQACGVPVVASRAGSLPEVVRGGVLVEPRSSTAIASAVVDMLRDDVKRRKLGMVGYEYTKKYTWKKAIDEHIKIYDGMVGDRSE